MKRKSISTLKNCLTPLGIIGLLLNTLQTALINLSFGYILKIVFDYKDMSNSSVYGIILLVILSVYIIFGMPLFGKWMEKNTNIYKYSLNKNVFETIIDKNENIYNLSHSSKYLNILQNDIPRGSNIISWITVGLMQAILSGLIAIIIIGRYSIKMLVLLLFIGIMVILINKYWVKKIRNKVIKIRCLVEERLKNIINLINNINLIKIYGLEDKEGNEIEKYTSEIYSNENEYHKYMNAKGIIEDFLFNGMFSIIIILYGAVLVSNKEISFGTLLLILQIAPGISFFFGYVSGYIANLQLIIVSLNMIDDVLKKDKPMEEKKEDVEVIEEIEFSNVSFSYPNGKRLLEKIDFELKPPNNLLIIGENGSGKSTVFKLAFGIIKPNRGFIKLNEQNINVYSRESLSRKIGIVPQTVSFYEDTVYNNIVLGRGDFSEGLVYEVLKVVDLEKWIEKEDKELDYEILENGKNLSGGQKSRLALARALVTNPDILFIDELDANLDEATLKKVLNNIKEFYKNMGIVRISHIMDDKEDYNILNLNNSR